LAIAPTMVVTKAANTQYIPPPVSTSTLIPAMTNGTVANSTTPSAVATWDGSSPVAVDFIGIIFHKQGAGGKDVEFINEYQQNIQQALTDIQTTAEKLKNTQPQIETAKSAVQIASSRYLNGIGLNTDITDAAMNLQRVLLTNLRYQYQLATSKVEYARVTGYKYW